MTFLTLARSRTRLPSAALLFVATASVAQSQIVIRAGSLIDGRGGTRREVNIVVDGSTITRIDAASRPRGP